MRRCRAQISQQRKRSLLSSAKHYGLSKDDAVTVNPNAGLQARRFDFGFVARRSEKCQTLTIVELEPRAGNLRHPFQPIDDLASSIFVLEAHGGATFTCGDFTDNRELVRSLLPQDAGLKIKERAESEQ